MPNNQSAKRRVRIAERNNLYNRYWKSRCKTAAKKVIESVKAGDSELATKRLNAAQSVLDKAVVKGVMHKNTVARQKASLAAKVKALALSKA